MKDIILKTENLEKSFKNLKVVDNISFSLEKGDVFGFIGPNGAGKTTTIRMILGLLKMDKGTIYINGHSIRDEYYEAVSSVGALVEGPAFYEYMSAEENLMSFGSYSGGITKAKVKELLKLVGLEDRGKDKVKTFSLGMKQRLGIAQALLNDPELLILDEPTNGLDPNGIKDIRNLIKKLSDQGKTIFISSHILSEVQNVCNKISIVKNGVELVFGNTEELISENGLYDISAVNNQQLSDILKNMHGVTVVQAGSKVRVKLSDDLLPEQLLRNLVNAGAQIRVYNPVNITLEDYFFQTTKEV